MKALLHNGPASSSTLIHISIIDQIRKSILIKYVKTLAGLYKDEKYLWVSPPSSKYESPSNKKTN